MSSGTETGGSCGFITLVLSPGFSQPQRKESLLRPTSVRFLCSRSVLAPETWWNPSGLLSENEIGRKASSKCVWLSRSIHEPAFSYSQGDEDERERHMHTGESTENLRPGPLQTSLPPSAAVSSASSQQETAAPSPQWPKYDRWRAVTWVMEHLVIQWSLNTIDRTN